MLTFCGTFWRLLLAFRSRFGPLAALASPITLCASRTRPAACLSVGELCSVWVIRLSSCGSLSERHHCGLTFSELTFGCDNCRLCGSIKVDCGAILSVEAHPASSNTANSGVNLQLNGDRIVGYLNRNYWDNCPETSIWSRRVNSLRVSCSSCCCSSSFSVDHRKCRHLCCGGSN
ncbi:hypothetical protein D3C78_1012200 [compost metagenome]